MAVRLVLQNTLLTTFRDSRQKCEIRDFMTGRVSAVVFNLFHTVAHFSMQELLTTHFDQQNLIPVTKIW